MGYMLQIEYHLWRCIQLIEIKILSNSNWSIARNEQNRYIKNRGRKEVILEFKDIGTTR